MSWTLGTIPLDGSTGFALASVELGNGMVDSATITSVANWNTAGPAVDTWLALKQGATTVLYGMITSVEPYANGGAAQGRIYTLSNPWWHLEGLPYLQTFKYRTASALLEKKRSKVWLGIDEGNLNLPCTTARSIEQVLNYAKENTGGAWGFELGSFGVTAPVTQVVDQTCAQVIQQYLRWHPDVQVFWRYTSGGATLHLKKLTELSPVTVKVAAAGASDPKPVTAKVLPRTELVPPCVVVKFERLNQFDNGEGQVQQFIEYHEDKAGSGSETSVGALVYTIELQGLQTTALVQPIRTRKVPLEYVPDAESAGADVDAITEALTEEESKRAVKWFQSHVAALRALPYLNIEPVSHVRVFDLALLTEEELVEEDALEDKVLHDVPPRPTTKPGEHDPERPPDAEDGDDEEPDMDDYPRELLEGTIQEWMVGVTSAPVISRGSFKFTGSTAGLTTAQLAVASAIFGTNLLGTATYDVRFTATDAITQRYRTMGSYTGPEAWPTGLASAIYSGIQTVRHQGTVTYRNVAVPLDALPGDMVTLSGQTGSGPVQRLSIDPQMGRATFGFGWPEHRSLQDTIELLRCSRQNPLSAEYDPRRKDKAQPASSRSAVQGSWRGPTGDTQMQVQAATTQSFLQLTAVKPAWYDGTTTPPGGTEIAVWITPGTVNNVVASNWDHRFTEGPGTYFFAKCTLNVEAPRLTVTEWEIVTGSESDSEETSEWSEEGDRPEFYVVLLGWIPEEGTTVPINTGNGSIIISEHVVNITKSFGVATTLTRDLAHHRKG